MAPMLPVSDSGHHPGLVLARFLERSQRYYFHEVRGRIGTIVNFAAVLEGSPSSGAETVDLAGRIRVNALASVRMVQLLGTAMELAARPPRGRPTDLCRLAQVIVGEAGGSGTVHSSGRGSTASVDPDLVAFVWRAFVAMQSTPAGCPIRGSSVSVAATPHECEVVLQLAADESPPLRTDAPEVDVQGYLRHGAGPALPEHAVAMTLAQHLVASHDGRTQLRGRPGERTSLRLVLPISEDAGSAL